MSMLSIFRKNRDKSPDTAQLATIQTYGLPPLAHCIAHDAVQKVLAVGTRRGQIQLYGQDEGSMSWTLPDKPDIKQLVFLQGKGYLIVVDELLTLWQWSVSPPVLIQSAKLQHEEPSIVHLPPDSHWALLGTSRGNVYFLHSETFERSRQSIMWNHISKQGLHPGSVKSIDQHPGDAAKILIFYEHGLSCIYDIVEKQPVQIMTINHPTVPSQLIWSPDGKMLLSGHADGSVLSWSPKSQDRPKAVFKEITEGVEVPVSKLIARGHGDRMITFASGGRIRADSTEHPFCVWARENGSNLYRQTSVSEVVDAIFLCDTPWLEEDDSPHALAVLFNDKLEIYELDAISESKAQLADSALFPICLGHGLRLHQSQITCMKVIENVPWTFVTLLWHVNHLQTAEMAVALSMPDKPGKGNRLLVTGHIDGGVMIWLFNDSNLRFLLQCENPHMTAPTLVSQDSSVARVDLSVVRHTLIVGYTSGQVIFYEIHDQPVSAKAIKGVKIELLLPAEQTSGPPSPTKKSAAPQFTLPTVALAPDSEPNSPNLDVASVEITEDMIEPLTKHGFEREEVIKQLKICQGDMNLALSELYTQDSSSKLESKSSKDENSSSKSEPKPQTLSKQQSEELKTARQIELEEPSETDTDASETPSSGHTSALEDSNASIDCQIDQQLPGFQIVTFAESHVVTFENSLIDQVSDLLWSDALNCLIIINHYGLNLIQFNTQVDSLHLDWHRGISCPELGKRSSIKGEHATKALHITAVLPFVLSQAKLVFGKSVDVNELPCIAIGTNRGELFLMPIDPQTPPVCFHLVKDQHSIISLIPLTAEGTPGIEQTILKSSAATSLEKLLESIESCTCMKELEVVAKRIQDLKGQMLLTEQELKRLREAYAKRQDELKSSDSKPDQKVSSSSRSSIQLSNLSAKNSLIHSMSESCMMTVVSSSAVHTILLNKRSNIESRAPKPQSPFFRAEICSSESSGDKSHLLVCISQDSTVTGYGLNDLKPVFSVNLFMPRKYRQLRSIEIFSSFHLLIPSLNNGLKLSQIVSKHPLVGTETPHTQQKPSSSTSSPSKSQPQASSDTDITQQKSSIFDADRAMPPKPKSGLGKVVSTLFSNTKTSEDREQLLGGSIDKREISAAMTRKTHVSDEQASSMHQLTRLQQQAQERQEKLKDIEDRAEQLADSGKNFASAASELADYYKNKKWWQF